MTQLSRRGFFFGLAAAIAAPAVIRSGILMPVSSKMLRPTFITLDYYAERILSPIINNLAKQVAESIMNGSGDVSQLQDVLDAEGFASYPVGHHFDLTLVNKQPWIEYIPLRTTPHPLR